LGQTLRPNNPQLLSLALATIHQCLMSIPFKTQVARLPILVQGEVISFPIQVVRISNSRIS